MFFQATEKKLSQISHNVGKSRLVNTVTASFNTTMRQMTKMYQQKRETHRTRTVGAKVTSDTTEDVTQGTVQSFTCTTNT